MKLIKLAIISFLVIFILITAMSLFIPSNLRISRAINVAADTKVMDKISDTTEWKKWHPGFMVESETISDRSFNRNPVQLDSNLIIYNVRQGLRPAVINGWELHAFPGADSSTLQWYMDFTLSWYPWQKFSSLFYETAYGSMMQEGLTNLKNSSH